MNDKRNEDLVKNGFDDEVSKALDDIFGNDFIELNVSNEKIETNDAQNDNDVVNDTYKLDEFDKNTKYNTEENQVLIDAYDTTENKNMKPDNLKVIKTDKKVDLKTVILVLLLCVLIAIIIIFVLTKNETQEQSSIVCYKKITTNDYDSTDEYVLNYSKNKLTYVSGTYTYKAKNETAINNMESIKEKKMDVIINSNGIEGFTHNYEVGEDSILISSYYDMELIDFSKIDNEIKKLSYLKLTSGMKVSDLENSLKKDGYTCTKGK